VVLHSVKVVVCIPARYESSRFPAKVLARETGKYLIQHTYEQALKAALPDRVLIAADDQRILDAAAEFTAPCVMTRQDHQSGTDRIAEAVAREEADIIVNLQGDEPEIDPAHLDLVADLLVQHPDIPMATLGCPLESEAQVANPNIVKVITTVDGRALYFSRSVLPHDRDRNGIGDPSRYLRHIGIYAYRKEFLQRITQQPQTPLEKTEKLEQLRVLEYGYAIQVGRVNHSCDGIDTPEQYQQFVERLKN
jgi:3-deoxy-manno-octulosonate cytidylyltransferase (CMP-KDO synthetase)